MAYPDMNHFQVDGQNHHRLGRIAQEANRPCLLERQPYHNTDEVNV
jgi:hypothetical protein